MTMGPWALLFCEVASAAAAIVDDDTETSARAPEVTLKNGELKMKC